MDVSDEERRDAENTGELIRKKLLEIMDLQADIDALMREKHPTPFGSARWKNSRPETLQRLVAITAIQFLLFEPEDWVKGNDEVKNCRQEVDRFDPRPVEIAWKDRTEGMSYRSRCRPVGSRHDRRTIHRVERT